MLDPFELVPMDIGRTNITDARLRNRWYRDDDLRLRKARELWVLKRNLIEVIIPMRWDTDVKTWVEDKRFKRQHYKSKAAMIRDMKF